MLQSMGSQSVRHDLATEQQQTTKDVMFNVLNIISSACMLYRKGKRVNPNYSHHKGKKILISLILYLCEIMDFH